MRGEIALFEAILNGWLLVTDGILTGHGLLLDWEPAKKRGSGENRKPSNLPMQRRGTLRIAPTHAGSLFTTGRRNDPCRIIDTRLRPPANKTIYRVDQVQMWDADKSSATTAVLRVV
jgi:hypothetical protein